MSEHGGSGGGGLFDEAKLEQKIGPLPAWAWAAILAGVAYFIYKRRQTKALMAAGTAGTVDPSLAGDTAADTGTVTAPFDPHAPIDQYLSQNPGSPAYPVGSVSNGVPAPITNEQWARLGADQLLQTGSDPTIVSNALSKYLIGSTLTAAEQAVVNSVLIAFGEPPQGIMPINVGGGGGTTTPPPVTKPPTVTPSGPLFQNKTVGVKTTSTLWGLAAQEYPNASAYQLEQIVYATVVAQPQYANNTVPGQHTVTFYADKVK